MQNVSCTPGYVKRQYAFGVKGVPRKETNWLEATCDFPSAYSARFYALYDAVLMCRYRAVGKRNEVDIPVDAAGEQYSHVFGSTATAFERLVVDHKIMGPCWLNLKSPKINKGDAVRLVLPFISAGQLVDPYPFRSTRGRSLKLRSMRRMSRHSRRPTRTRRRMSLA